jgi:hypothetical protein
LAVGDLNGDGIDEMIVRIFMYEPEDDRIAILEWQQSALMSIYDTARPRKPAGKSAPASTPRR